MTGSQSRSSGGESGSSGQNIFPAMRDKLQSSARDLIKSMEQVVGRGKPASDNVKSLESTLRAVFSSCTSGADANVTANSEEEYADRNHQPKQTSLSHQTHQAPGMASRVPQKEMGEHIYAQLFFDDQARAAKAVNALKEIDVTAAKSTNLPATSSYYPSQQLSKPFPASSPARPVQQSDFDILPTNTFDDSISAISQHTLEAMARASAPSGQNSYFPQEVPASKYNDRVVVERVDPSPVFVPKEHVLYKPYSPTVRVRSTGDQSSPSKNSQTTRTTTDSSSFENWQREEKKYWVDQAKKDQLVKKNRRPSQGELVSISLGGCP